ncbi:MAG: hypothetical protein Q7R96_00920 [Nanoarchaeota archaeon]|nr:hypothetical protein [Nanoarchaeota archaeon]
MNKQVYLDVVLQQVPRLLGLIDRNPLSPTFGCADRQFWHYKVVDFPAARFQESCLTLALLYTLDHPKNPYFKNKLMLQWSKAVINFWVNMQRSDGSFDEWYPFEHSFVASAFSAAAVAEALLVFPELQSPEVMRALERVGNFLLKSSEVRVQNQLTGALLALYNIFLLTKNPLYEKGFLEKLAVLEKLQSSEGWFAEYGGVDVGYLSLAVDYLGKLFDKSRSMDVLVMAEKAVNFLHAVLHPDGSFGGVYASRNTEYCIPAGVELLPSATAASLAYHIRKSLARNAVISPASLDDRYVAYIMYTYLQAFIAGKDNVEPLSRSKATQFFPHAGLIVQQVPFFFLLNVHKGGAFRAVFKDRVLLDAGIQVRTKKSRLFSGYMQPVVSVPVNDKVAIEGYLVHTTSTLMSPLKMLLLHGFQMAVGRFGFFSTWLKSLLRDVLIQGKQKSKIRFRREVSYTPQLQVVDTLFNVPPCRIILGGKASYNAVPSSKYFQQSELDSIPVEVVVHKHASVKIIRAYGKDGVLVSAPEVVVF